LTAEERLELRRLYHCLFRSGLTLRRAIDRARQEFSSPVALPLIDFVAASKRGVCADRTRGPLDQESA
jgi:acyl-[acyl carrier protein]--UDP-N-acetylglucosamine O-acyltransferase